LDLYQAKILVEKAKSGDRKAQKKLYDTYRVYLFGVANLYANTKAEAEDILLEGFYRIFKDLHSFNASGDIRAWMRKVVVNSALMHLRKYRKWENARAFQDDAILKIPDHIDFRSEVRAQSILALIRMLPEPQRIIFSLKGIEGYSYKEISQKLDIKEVTLRSHYIRARKRLQHVLQNELE